MKRRKGDRDQRGWAGNGGGEERSEAGTLHPTILSRTALALGVFFSMVSGRKGLPAASPPRLVPRCPASVLAPGPAAALQGDQVAAADPAATATLGCAVPPTPGARWESTPGRTTARVPFSFTPHEAQGRPHGRGRLLPGELRLLGPVAGLRHRWPVGPRSPSLFTGHLEASAPI